MSYQVNGQDVDYPIEAAIKHLNTGTGPATKVEVREYSFSVEDYFATEVYITVARNTSLDKWELRSYAMSYVDEDTEGESCEEGKCDPWVVEMNSSDVTREDVTGELIDLIINFMETLNTMDF